MFALACILKKILINKNKDKLNQYLFHAKGKDMEI